MNRLLSCPGGCFFPNAGSELLIKGWLPPLRWRSADFCVLGDILVYLRGVHDLFWTWPQRHPLLRHRFLSRLCRSRHLHHLGILGWSSHSLSRLYLSRKCLVSLGFVMICLFLFFHLFTPCAPSHDPQSVSFSIAAQCLMINTCCCTTPHL